MWPGAEEVRNLRAINKLSDSCEGKLPLGSEHPDPAHRPERAFYRIATQQLRLGEM